MRDLRHRFEAGVFLSIEASTGLIWDRKRRGVILFPLILKREKKKRKCSFCSFFALFHEKRKHNLRQYLIRYYRSDFSIKEQKSHHDSKNINSNNDSSIMNKINFAMESWLNEKIKKH